VVDLLAQTSRCEGLMSQADAQRTAGEPSEDNRILDEPREVRVKVGGSWRFGDAKAAQRRVPGGGRSRARWGVRRASPLTHRAVRSGV
jgi:hypothetical protein